MLQDDLNRQQGWLDLKAELMAKGERLVPYSFRHSYSLRAHRRNIDAGSAAGTEAAFQRAHQALVATSGQPPSA